jgi:AraC family transcriptional regulator
MQAPDRVLYDVFHLGGQTQRWLYSDVTCRSGGGSVATIGYRSHGPESPVVGCVFTNPAVVLHRRGRRIVGLRHDGRGSDRPAHDGLVSLFPAGWEIRPNYLEPCEGLLIALSPRLVTDTAQRLGTPAGFPAVAGLVDGVLEGICETLWRAGGGSDRLSEALGRAAVTHVLERYAPAAPVVPAWFRRAERYVQDHLAGPLTVGALAAAAGMSRSHFTRLFRQTAGVPPHAYVLRRRVERAKELMAADADLPLADVAAEVGFYDQSHLTAHFRNLVGVTPAAYRANARPERPSG